MCLSWPAACSFGACVRCVACVRLGGCLRCVCPPPFFFSFGGAQFLFVLTLCGRARVDPPRSSPGADGVAGDAWHGPAPFGRRRERACSLRAGAEGVRCTSEPPGRRRR
eukprot:16184471-Heterocapsa_arctica.AAC.1